MGNKDKQNGRPRYVESSLGIVTMQGHWFHTTSDQIKSLAPGLLAECSLNDLVIDAEAWIKSADSLSLLSYLVLALVIPPIYASIIVLGFFFFWHTQKSALVTPYITTFLKWINKDATLIITAGLLLSWFGMSGRYLAMILGIVFYFIFKLGLLRWGYEKLRRRWNRSISLNDRLFKMMLVKYAIYYGITPPEIEKMDEKIKEMMRKRK